MLLLVRETPLHLGHLGLLVQVAELRGCHAAYECFVPPPEDPDEVEDQTVNRNLDLLDIELGKDLFTRLARAAPARGPTT